MNICCSYDLIVLDFLVYVKRNKAVSNYLLLIFFFTVREISKLGDLVNMDVCMEILDILYETEDTSWLFNFACPLAASTLVCSLNALTLVCSLTKLHLTLSVSIILRLLRTLSQFLSRNGSFQ
jgi:hypothetical protein